VLGTLLAAPAVALLARTARNRNLAAILRPGAEGRSSQRCASCGSTGHSMLRCTDSPKVV
jgi:hypothetical protein